MSTKLPVGPPNESYGRLFLRFLRYGCVAWGGPVAQIGMLRQDLVEDEHWIDRERFNRVLALYQALPGPEAHELCVYFGMLARGRLGGLLAGLGFMLPGFSLMFGLSWFYVTFGLGSPLFAAIFFGFKPAAGALIVRAVHRIGQHALLDRWLWLIALGAGAATLGQVNGLLVLVAGGAASLVLRGRWRWADHPLLLLVVPLAGALVASVPSLLDLLGLGLRAGLLTFGGAYTAIPLVQDVAVGQWLTNAQFLDGIALAGILPTPLIMFTTFVGYLGGGPLGAVIITAGVFIPAFSFTLFAHQYFEQLLDQPQIRVFLDGITAAVVGLITISAVELLRSALPNWLACLIFSTALVILYRWRAKQAIVFVMLGAGLAGLLTLQ